MLLFFSFFFFINVLKNGQAFDHFVGESLICEPNFLISKCIQIPITLAQYGSFSIRHNFFFQKSCM